LVFADSTRPHFKTLLLAHFYDQLHQKISNKRD
jgi:hypothetical protein